MFTTLQLKPHVALSLTFLAWSGWLLEHAVGHAEMIAEHGTGFVPVGFDLDYPRPAGFFDVRELTVSVRVTTWNSGPALPTVQLVDCAIEAPGKSLVRVRLQEVCVRVVSASDLSARPGRVPGSLSILL
ncbi:MAG: hypothetical protein HOV83_14850, partial [Catenulispora sp.]|nr:hypothetical protein [Catenulispora sp.]